MSIFVMQTMTGTFNASAIPRCSLSTSLVTVDRLNRTNMHILAHTDQTVVGSDH